MAFRNLVAAGVAGLALTATASAADLGRYQARGPQVTEFFSMWYLRGDAGYRFNSLTNGVYPGGVFSSTSLQDSGTLGGGVGYKYGWFRSDITVDYGTRPEFTGTLPGQTVTARLGNYTALLNSYIDFGTWYGFTPYIGAGLGYSFLKPTDFFNTALLSPTLTTDSRWTPSWAVMAGFSYLFSPIWLVDVSYRYLDIGESVSNLQNGTGVVRYGEWTTQEIRVGLRYLIP